MQLVPRAAVLEAPIGGVYRGAGGHEAALWLQLHTHHGPRDCRPRRAPAPAAARLCMLAQRRQQRHIRHERRCSHASGRRVIARLAAAACRTAAGLQQLRQKAWARAHRALRRDVLRAQQRRQQLLHVSLLAGRRRRHCC